MFKRTRSGYFSLLVLCVVQNLFSIAPNSVVGIVTDITPATFNSPYALAFTPDGTKAYAVNAGGNSVSIVNALTATVVGEVIDLNPATLNDPNAIAITPDGKKAYVVNDNGNSVSVIDVATNKVTAQITDASFNDPVNLAITANGSKIYVVNSSGNSITIINALNNTVTGTVNLNSFVLNSPEDIVFAPNDQTAYVTSINTNAVLVINVNSDTVIAQITDASFSSPDALVITPDGLFLYVANVDASALGSPYCTISVVSTTSRTVVNTLISANFIEPYGIAISPDGTTVYVVDIGTNTITLIDTSTNSIIGMVTDLSPATLNEPYVMAVAPNGDVGYVGNLGNNTVSIVFLKSPAPSAVQVQARKNVFLTQTDLINVVTWSAPASGTAQSYKLYRDAGLTQLITTAQPSGLLQYYDHNRQPNAVYSYYIVALDQYGYASLPISTAIIS